MDSEALGNLIDRYAAALELYARQWTDAPEDVVQEAFMKLAEQRRYPSNPAAWLFRTVRNAAINAGIASRRRQRHEARAAAETPAWFQPLSSALQESAFDLESAQQALAGLPAEQREAIVAHIWAGLTFEQIGDLMGTSASSAHRHHQAGLVSLRERLGVSCPSNPKNPTSS
jgi:RNA polymerase sigma-70 factor (ECF subfamily)